MGIADRNRAQRSLIAGLSLLLLAACTSPDDQALNGQEQKWEAATRSPKTHIVKSCQYRATIYGGPSAIRYELHLHISDNSYGGTFSGYDMDSNSKLFYENLSLNAELIRQFCAKQYNIILNAPPASRNGVTTIMLDPIPLDATVIIDGRERKKSVDSLEDALMNPDMLKGIRQFLRNRQAAYLPEPGWYDMPEKLKEPSA